MTELLAALIGALAATLGTLAWETCIRPAQERKRTASVLRVEVAANRQYLVSLQIFLNKYPDSLPTDIDFEWAVYDALSSSLGTLKVDELVPTVQMYAQIRYLARLTESYYAEWEHTRVKEGSDRQQDAESRRKNILMSFKSSIDIALGAAELSFARLDAAAEEQLGASLQAVESYERKRQAQLHKEQR